MRFNLNLRAQAAAPVRNHEGAPAYPLTPAQELYAAVATAALSDQFYKVADARLARLRALVAQNDPPFVARLAVYAREQLYLRSVPLVLAVESAAQRAGAVPPRGRGGLRHQRPPGGAGPAPAPRGGG